MERRLFERFSKNKELKIYIYIFFKDIISLGEKRKILQDVIENKEETDFTRLITEFRKVLLNKIQ